MCEEEAVGWTNTMLAHIKDAIYIHICICIHIHICICIHIHIYNIPSKNIIEGDLQHERERARARENEKESERERVPGNRLIRLHQCLQG